MMLKQQPPVEILPLDAITLLRSNLSVARQIGVSRLIPVLAIKYFGVLSNYCIFLQPLAPLLEFFQLQRSVYTFYYGSTRHDAYPVAALPNMGNATKYLHHSNRCKF